jgi:hypothetical protein
MAASFKPRGLPKMKEVWGWHKKLQKMGTRYTGSPGHVKFINWLKAKFKAVPGFHLYSDPIRFDRWLADKYSLSIDQGAGRSKPVDVSYYYPYSGKTGPKGISGRLVDLGKYDPIWYTPAFWTPAAGEIALVKVPPSTFSLDFGQIPTGGFERKQTSQQAALNYLKYAWLVTHPVFQGMFAAVPLLDARNAGVRGVICVWTGMSDDQVANQYNPLTTGYPNKKGVPVPGDPGCPALWVGESTGKSLADSAKTGQAKVTLTLTAKIKANAVTETLWGVLPASGADRRRSLIVNTHTDGPNVPEENGALGMLALARYFAKRKRRRDLYFVMATGHFQLPQFIKKISNRFVVGNDAISRWMHKHPEIYQNALAGLSMEHLGCQRWADDANGKYSWTGDYEWGPTYTTPQQGSLDLTNLVQEAYLAAVQATNKSGATAHPVVTMLPMPLFFGEGAPLYAGGLGTVSLCPVPSYLLQAGSRTNPKLLNLDKLDKRLIYGQILTFARTISALDATDF